MESSNETLVLSANHNSLLPPRPCRLEHGDLAPGPGQRHRHPAQVGHHDVRLGRGGLAQTLQVLKLLGLDCVALKQMIERKYECELTFSNLEMFKFRCPSELWSLDTFPDAAPWSDLRQEEAVLLDFPHLDRDHSVDIIISTLPEFYWLFLLDRQALSWLNLLSLRISHGDAGMAEGFP